MITVASEEQWQKLCRALETPEWQDDPRFNSGEKRSTHLTELRQAIQHCLSQLSRAEATERFEKADVPCAPVRTAAEVMADDQLAQRGTLRAMRHAKLQDPVEGGVVVGFPILFSGRPLPDLPGAPTLGMHNQEIFSRLLGLNEERLQQLQTQGVV